MPTLKQKIVEDQKSAMRAGNAPRLSTIRLLSAAISNREIELRKKDIGLSDEEILDVIGAEARKRKDAIAEFQNAGRTEMADKESAELAILQEYLPPEMFQSARILRQLAYFAFQMQLPLPGETPPTRRIITSSRLMPLMTRSTMC